MSSTAELPDLVTAAEIARRLTPPVSRQRVQQLAHQDGFPHPVGRLGNYVIYQWRDVEKWARQHDRL